MCKRSLVIQLQLFSNGNIAFTPLNTQIIIASCSISNTVTKIRSACHSIRLGLSNLQASQV
jgi:hypothetical protein